MQVCPHFPRTEALIESYAAELGSDLPGYRNHVCRVLNYFMALTDAQTPVPESVAIAAAFHDIGIWTDHSFDYLEPSIRRARAYLVAQNSESMEAEVVALIREHHKLLPYSAHHAASVEAFRKADLVDVSLGMVRFDLPSSFVRLVKARFPNEGFHRRLVNLTARQFLLSPLRPLPMVHW